MPILDFISTLLRCDICIHSFSPPPIHLIVYVCILEQQVVTITIAYYEQEMRRVEANVCMSTFVYMYIYIYVYIYGKYELDVSISHASLL